MSLDNLFAQKGPLLFTYSAPDVQATRDRLRLTPGPRRARFLAEKSRVDFVFHTIALEGNPFTFPEVKTLLDSVTVGGHKLSDTDQVLNLNRALTHVLALVKSQQFKLDAATACAIQGIVAREKAPSWGQFRDGRVDIEGTDYQPPAAADLARVFDTGAQALGQIDDRVLRAMLTFLWGSLNRFFYDGNKRTSRFMANGTLLTAGLPPIMILAKDQLAYNQTMTHFYDTQDSMTPKTPRKR